MIQLQRQIGLMPPQPVAIAGTKIQPAAPAPLQRARPAGPCQRAFCTPEQSSRLPGPAGEGAWKTRWHAALDPAFKPTAVVQDGDRVLVHGGGLWQLFDLKGKFIKKGRYGLSGAVMDAAHGVFYAMDSNNTLSAVRLADGEEEYNVDVAFGDVFARPFIARRGSRLLEIGVEREAFPHRHDPPNRAVLHTMDLPAQVQVGATKMVENLTAAAVVHVDTAQLVAAMTGDALVFAVPGRVYHATTELTPTRALDGEFVPRMLSVDELGRAHLIVDQDPGRALWVVAPDATRTVSVALPAALTTLVAPPIVGYDHRVFLVAPDTVAAYESDGRPAWQHAAKSVIAGAAVTSDDQLVVTGGDGLAAYAPSGARRSLATFGEPLLTAPAMSARGELFVASADSLYCLAR